MSDASSDSSSVTSSVTSFGDISVCDEIGQLIDQCHQLHEHIHNSFETLNNIKHLVGTSNNITVTYNGSTSDFDEVLESLHTEALENIKAGNKSNFGQRLIDTLNIISFHN
jgi:hypothetical protein